MGGAAPIGATGSVGTLLRETRERRGQDLGFVANALRIRQPYLLAIEEGRSADLPGSTYAVGFVRGYADYLGLDSKEIVRRFRQENGEFANRAELIFPSAVSEGSIPTAALLGLTVLIAATVYGAWYWYQSREPSMATAVPSLPERFAALIHQPVGSGSELVAVDRGNVVDNGKVNEVPQPPMAVPAPAAIASFPSVPPSSAGTTGNPGAVPQHEDVVPPAEEDGSAASSASQTAAPAPLPAGTVADGATGGDVKALEAKPDDNKAKGKGKGKSKDAKADPAKLPVAQVDIASTTPSGAIGESKPVDVSGGATPPSRVILRAKEDCWIEIRDAKGKVVQNRVLRKGEVFPAPSRPGLTMTVGNAGALSLLVDGKATGTLGGIGMVRRDLPLDAERLRDGVPAAPEASPTESSAPPSSSGTSGTE